MTKRIHVVGTFAIEDASVFMRQLNPRYQGDLEVLPYADNIAFKNAVRPDRLPDILVLNNRLVGVTANGFAASLRSEGYRGKIFIYTGGHDVPATPAVDEVFYKPGDTDKIRNALLLALRAAR